MDWPNAFNDGFVAWSMGLCPSASAGSDRSKVQDCKADCRLRARLRTTKNAEIFSGRLVIIDDDDDDDDDDILRFDPFSRTRTNTRTALETIHVCFSTYGAWFSTGLHRAKLCLPVHILEFTAGNLLATGT